MTIALFFGLLLMIIGTIMGCLCGLIKEIPRSVLLCFAVIFVYFIALSIDTQSANAIFITSIPFFEQIKNYNVILQQLNNVNDWTTIYQTLSDYFISMNFYDEVIKLWFFSLEVGLIHILVFPKRRFSLWIDWFIWYLLEALAVGILIIVNYLLSFIINRYIPDFVTVWLPRILVALLILIIISSAIKLITKFVFPFLDLFISFFTKNLIGKAVISSVTTTGILILITFFLIIFKIPIPNGILISAQLLPMIIPFIIIWYIVYALIGYKKR